MENPIQMLDLIKSEVDRTSFFINNSHLINLHDKVPLDLPSYLKMEYTDIKNERSKKMLFLKINKLVYDEKENINDKLTSVYAALYNFQSDIIMIVDGKLNRTDFYIGILNLEYPTVAYDILEKSLLGNFPGVNKDHANDYKIGALNVTEMNNLMDELIPTDKYSAKSVSSVFIVPAQRDDDKDKFVQGIEKFIDTMQGEIYTAVFISSPLSKATIEDEKFGLELIYSEMSKVAKPSISYAENKSYTFTKTETNSESNSITKGISKSNGHGSSFSFLGSSTNRNVGKVETYNETTGDSKSSSTSIADTAGTTSTIQITYEDKTVINLMEKIDEQLKRIKNCESYGMWESACYFISDSNKTSLLAANTYKALVAGEESSVDNSFINLWQDENRKSLPILRFLRCGIHPSFVFEFTNYDRRREIFTSAAKISGKELPLFMGLPHKSVSGFTVIEQATFGRDVFTRDNASTNNTVTRSIELGSVYHMDKIYNNNRIRLDLDSLCSHCFVTGSTGAGKSNTVYKMLEEIISDKNKVISDNEKINGENVKFLVIEPAKGEYKKTFGGLLGINIFTTNPRYNNMLSINPFKFNEEIHVLEHLDRLIEIFSACWPLYAAMPALLKASFERAYVLHGWDIKHSIWMDRDNGKFPTFHDVLKILPILLKEKEFSADTKGDYIGALVTRVESLTNGLTGQIFTNNAIDENILFNENTIIDLSRVGSSETQSLIMGIIVLKLTEFRQSEQIDMNLPLLRHVTVLEEAHNLLKRTSTEQGQETANVQGKAVEMISRSIAEMRAYGEGFIIVDQSPTSVDISAIKNTNTKIVMNLPEANDCETVGHAIGLKEEQIKELSRLSTGVAAVYQNKWLEAVLVKVDERSKQYDLATTSINNHEDKKALLGELIANLFERYNKGQFDIDKNAVNGIISKYDENRSIKNQIKTILDKYESQIKEQTSIELRKKLYANLIYDLFDGDGLFNIFNDILPEVKERKDEITVEYKERCKRYSNYIRNNIASYATIADEQITNDVLNQLLLSRIFSCENDDRYGIIWQVERGNY